MEENYEYPHYPSGGTVLGCIVLTAIAMMALIILTSGHSDTENSHATVIPDTGTYEYQLFLEDFETKYGREFTIDDYMTALHNGVHVQIGVLGFLFCVPIAYFTVYDWYWYLTDRKLYYAGEIDREPKPLSMQLLYTTIVLVVMAFLASYLWLVVPSAIQPMS